MARPVLGVRTHPLHHRIPLILTASTWVGLCAAQNLRVVAPVGAIAAQEQDAGDDLGVPVRMFENPNLDRYLRGAQSFLDQQKYDSAIEVLQDVIQGRTVEFLSGGQVPDDPAAKGGGEEPKPGGDEPKPGVGAPNSKDPKANAPVKRSHTEQDAANSVFSQDGRLYRPVSRLCHELLAHMPAHAIELYRALYEADAEAMLASALESGSIQALESVVNRYFVTIASGKAMIALADRFMHGGRYRAAVQVLRDLVDLYPKDGLKRAGADVLWCRFKIALCISMAGEPGAAQDEIKRLAADFPDDSLRIRGQLQSVRDMPGMEIFAHEVERVLDAGRAESLGWLGGGSDRLVPMWQYRFIDPDPYRNPKSTKNSNERVFFGGEGYEVSTMPTANQYGPASWLRFAPGRKPGEPTRALFLDHYCLRVADARTGLLLQETAEPDKPPAPRENYPRVRIAVVDNALLRPVEDEARRYVVLGHRRNPTQTVETFKSSALIAYDRTDNHQLWSTEEFLEGDNGMRDVTFLAAPTVFGERLLVPALRRDAYTLECIDRNTGRPQWHTKLHSGGTSFFKAPGSPVAVAGGIAFVVTNAGCLAAVDAFAGDLKWIRRYERDDPLRPRARPKRTNREAMVYAGSQFTQAALSGFLPSDLVVSNGMVVMAACDSAMLLCLDSATGRPLWMVDGASKYNTPFGTLRLLLGANSTDLFALADNSLVCIGLSGGLVKWHRELPPVSGGKDIGRGHGLVTEDWVLVPGEREVLVFDSKGKTVMQRLPLPQFGQGSEPFAGPFNIVSSGPWLGVGYQSGIEVFSSVPALRKAAASETDPLTKVGYLVAAGDRAEAEKLLEAMLHDPNCTPANHLAGSQRLLELVRARAAELVHEKHLPEALAALDAIAPMCAVRSVRLDWHLARIELCLEAGDLHAHEAEQQRLYDFMEGKG
ncbi:MAG: PQQ-binding-like beta-propeller repeat protein [Planctomycetota bacterium]